MGFEQPRPEQCKFQCRDIAKHEFRSAKIQGAKFYNTVSGGFTKEQLYSTASYQRRELTGIQLGGNDLLGWNFRGQDLRFADLGSNLWNTDFSLADLRSARIGTSPGRVTRNAIMPNGVIEELYLEAGERLVAFAGTPLPVQITDSLAIAETGAFDITDNAVIVWYDDVSPADAVRAQIIAGRDGSGLGGTWTGTGITSSAAAAANAVAPQSHSIGYADNATLPAGPYETFHGQPVDSTSVLIAYTRTGDANLDGVVNNDDVTIMGVNYAPGVPKPHWALGDFDYNGFVDNDDVTLLGVFYDPTASPIPAPLASATVAAIPDPSTLTLAIFSAIAAVLRATRPKCLP